MLRNQPVYTQVAAANAKTAAPVVVSSKPVIYRVNMKDVSNLALMQRFQMMDGDIIYASNASLVDFAKLFNVYQKSVPTAAAPIPGSSGN